MELWQVLVLSIVEGLTEFVPVSSTGHLILLSRLFGLRGPAVDAFSVVVQLGALLAAVFYYRRTLWETLVGVVRRKPESLRLFRNLVLGSASASKRCCLRRCRWRWRWVSVDC